MCAGAILALLVGSAHAAPGDLDPSFSQNGLVTTHFGVGPSTANDLAIQSDGKLVVAGSAGGDLALARYRPNGELDSSFSSNGKLTHDFGGNDTATGVAIQADGRIVVVGDSYDSSAGAWHFLLARYDADGSPDSSFSGDGHLTGDFGGTSDYANDIAIDGDGNLVIAGSKFYLDAAVARFTPDGSPDKSFSGDGLATLNFGGTSHGNAVAIAPDGSVILAGDNSEHNGFPNESFAVAQLKPNGDPDPSFSGDGQATATIGELASAYDVALHPDGKIVAVGNSCGGDVHSICITAAARFGSDGTLDQSFNGTGTKSFYPEPSGYGSYATSLVNTPDGGAVIAGGTTDVNDSGGPYDFALIRLDQDGSPDPAYRGDGIWTTDFLDHEDGANAVALQEDGKIVAAGASGGKVALARYDVAAGPHDADADGVRDRADRCPDRYSADPSGCPSYRRTLTMKYRPRRDLDAGVLASREPKCVDSKTVRVYRARRGADLLVDKAVTDYRGKWSIDARLHPGHYYAVAKATFDRAYGRCLKARASGFRL